MSGEKQIVHGDATILVVVTVAAEAESVGCCTVSARTSGVNPAVLHSV